MSEEVKAPENTEKADNAPAGEAKETVVASKTKKINRMSLGDLNKKIEDLQSKKLDGSLYFAQLLGRKAELEG